MSPLGVRKFRAVEFHSPDNGAARTDQTHQSMSQVYTL